jgi:4-amino-4-deoxy-L-arabinose transferase-like glycosyltransferase
MENWIITTIAISQIAWLWTLLAHLKNEECDPTDKICWTLVLVILNALGMVLFLIGGPKVKDESHSEEALKRAFNEGRR